MKHLSSYILPILTLLCLLVGCSGRGKVIPASTMSEIYADMLIADYWLRDHTQYMRQADTTLFYDPIFRRYGYSFEDYDASVRHYIKDPTRMYKIFKNTVNILTKSQKEHIIRRDMIEKLMENMEGMTTYQTLAFIEDSLLWRSYDTLLFWNLDSLTRDSILRERFVLDSLRLDSLKRDSLVRDSLMRDSLLKVKPLSLNRKNIR